MEKDAEAVVDTVADDADAVIKGAAKEAVGDVDKLVKDAESGPGLARGQCCVCWDQILLKSIDFHFFS